MLLEAHRTLGYAAIYANAAAGLWMLAAWRVGALRGLRWRWWPVIGAEVLMMTQVVLGVVLVSAQDYAPPRFHMFYGFVAFITVGLLYSYRYVWKARGWMELAYGLGGLFLMGLGIRAVLQISAG